MASLNLTSRPELTQTAILLLAFIDPEWTPIEVIREQWNLVLDELWRVCEGVSPEDVGVGPVGMCAEFESLEQLGYIRLRTINGVEQVKSVPEKFPLGKWMGHHAE